MNDFHGMQATVNDTESQGLTGEATKKHMNKNSKYFVIQVHVAWHAERTKMQSIWSVKAIHRAEFEPQGNVKLVDICVSL
jgi:hypothetical protein